MDKQVDLDFENLVTQFNQHVRATTHLLTALRTALEAVRKCGAQTKAFSTSLSTFYSQPVAMLPPAYANEAITILDSIQPPIDEMVSTCESQTLKELHSYIEVLTQLQKSIRRRNFAQRELAYYTNKVTSMKRSPPKDPNRLPRNEAKMEQATERFKAINFDVTTRLSNAISQRAETLQSPLMTLMHALSFGAQSIHDSAGKWNVVLKMDGFGVMTDPAAFQDLATGLDTRTFTKLGSERSSMDSAQFVATATPMGGEEATGPSPSETSAVRVIGAFPFQAEEADELSFEQGEELIVIDQVTDDAWWLVENKAGQRGMVPFNYVELVK
eukprot:c6410_g1_i2.p1 GENE.c6410_g1_i2~~c6410_g1_i2.p1  ORF type:complete len:356 (+),score=77.16 c6410_g1_i2:85-1068(+)